MTDRDNITLPREVVVAAIAALDSVEWLSSRVIRKRGDEAIAALRAHLAAPPEDKTHPGYVIGSHWLETAYSRICAGEAEADVLRDCGWERVDEALRRDAERLREALKLAFSCHGKVLMSDPPQDAWKFHRVDEVIAAALRGEDV